MHIFDFWPKQTADLISLKKPNVIRMDNEIKPDQKYLFSIFCDEPKIETEYMYIYKFIQFDLNKPLNDPVLSPFLETRKSLKNLPKPSHPLNAITTIQFPWEDHQLEP